MKTRIVILGDGWKKLGKSEIFDWPFDQLPEKENTISKGAHALQHYNQIVPYLRQLSRTVRDQYPDMCQSLSRQYSNSFTPDGLPLIYRFIN